MYKNWNKCIISENDTVASAIKNLSSNGLQIYLVVNGKKRLVGTVFTRWRFKKSYFG